MPSRKRKRDVLVAQAFELRVAGLCGQFEDLAPREAVREGVEPRSVAPRHRTIACRDQCPEIHRRDLVPAQRHPAPQHVVGDVGEVVGGADRVAGLLQAVCRGHDPDERSVGAGDCVVQRRRVVVDCPEIAAQGDEVGLFDSDVGDDSP